MLSQSSILYRQARTLSSFSASLCVRICSSQLCKNLGVTKRHEPRVDKVLDTAKRSFELRYRSLSTASCYLKESRTTTDEPLDTLKDESNLNSGFFDEEDADISNLQKTRSKLRSAFAEYTLDEDGYMNIQDLVEFLRRESAIDICVIKTRGNRQTYVDYFVVVSGVSTRHIRAMAKNLEQLFKGRELRGIGQTGHVGVEGMESNHWVVLDIGNIVVHFFLPEVREVYELEKLWTLGPKYDDQSKAYLEEEILRQAAEFGIKLDDPDADGENPVV
ncbi:Mitochondrial assembly of ribosomal large subunit protein 1 [Desmophyllum pertusum]|uniref:Mitochondrial assembly of ribosomal large subunit protein 1 n=1 Tax=Desmophyllum pertusum TaxID=174260 RepID=A0A9W9YJD0_9CNID|nr:Mitochondrial assembly of ribosomal large subunit protein 1 [Desmophyllum pertusum]